MNISAKKITSLNGLAVQILQEDRDTGLGFHLFCEKSVNGMSCWLEVLIEVSKQSQPKLVDHLPVHGIFIEGKVDGFVAEVSF